MLERERIDIGGLCRSVGEALASRAASKNQLFDCVIEASAGTVIGDSRRLRESVEHVLRNAIAYTDEGGKIGLRASGDAGEAVIAISDDGPGIAVEHQAMVFDRFHRVMAGARGEAALGLGLPLTRQFIEAHGGTVVLVSTPGKGTAVTLTVPRAPQ